MNADFPSAMWRYFYRILFIFFILHRIAETQQDDVKTNPSAFFILLLLLLINILKNNFIIFILICFKKFERHYSFPAMNLAPETSIFKARFLYFQILNLNLESASLEIQNSKDAESTDDSFRAEQFASDHVKLLSGSSFFASDDSFGPPFWLSKKFHVSCCLGKTLKHITEMRIPTNAQLYKLQIHNKNII